MNICKSCGVTIHEEGQSFCPACKSTAKEASVGFAGGATSVEKVELKMEDEEPKQVTSLKLSSDKAGDKTDPDKTGKLDPNKTDKINTSKLDEEFKRSAASPASAEKPRKPEADDDRLSISESPLAEAVNLAAERKGEENLKAAVEKSGPKSYLSAEERKALLSELDRPKTAVKEPPPKISLSKEAAAKPEKRSAAMTLREPSPAEPARADKLPPTAVSRGIAYFSGTNIHLVGGAHLASNEELIFKDRIYVLKEKSGTESGGSRWLYMVSSVILVLAATLLWIISRPAPGGIAGLVLDSRSQSTLPGARVRLLENEETAVTNEAGFFVLPRIPAGNYNLQGEAPGVEGRTLVQVAKGGIAPVIVTLNPTPEEIISSAPILNPRPAARKEPEVPAPAQPVTVALNLSLDPADAEAFLDGQPLGNGGIFKDLPPGRHTLNVRRDGFQEYEKPLELKTGKTNQVKVALVPKTAAPAPVKKGFEDYLKEGDGYLARREFGRAVTAFSEAIKLRPGSALAHSLLGEAHEGASDFGSAQKYYLRAAGLYARDGSYDKAEQLYARILEADPSQAEALLALGNLQVGTGNVEAARASFQQYNKQFGNSPEGYFALGKLEYQERRFKEAAKAFERALSNSSQPGLVYGYLTLTYIQNDSKKKAQSAYENFMKLATPEELSFLKAHRDWSRVVADLSVRE